jgi:hypothetical protein
MRGLRHGGRGHSAASRRNPIHKPNPAFDAVAKLTGCCQQIVDLRQTTASRTLLSGFLDEGMRSRDLKIIRACRDSLTAFLETADAE